MAYGRASGIPGPIVTLFGLGAGEGKVSRDDWAGPIGAEIGLTGILGVGVLRSKPWIEAGGAGSGIGVPSFGTWVVGRVLGCAGL